VTAATVASLGLLVGGLATVAGLSQVGSGAPTTVATTDEASPDGPATTGGLTTVPLVSVSTSQPAPPTTIDGFATGADASAAAEGLLTGYIASQHGVDVTDPACSEPASGAVGETFACYALKPGDLVIALRATIGEERLITLELITNQEPTTTTTTTVAPPPTEPAPATAEPAPATTGA
jgi:hypothetical protein